jgi:undecaprenyl-diphosphatase
MPEEEGTPGPLGAEPDEGTMRASPAERLAVRLEGSAAVGRSAAASILHDLGQLDVAVYRAVAQTPTPSLDAPLRRLTGWANNSKLWLLIAAGLFALGGKPGRRAAITGVAALGMNSAIVNIPVKLASGRARPDREAAQVPDERRVPMPTSTSFPSGHSASGFAFADAVAAPLPAAAIPIRGLAVVVAYSRVHTGVHYPGDVIVGALIGGTIGESVGAVARRLTRRRRLRAEARSAATG